MAKKINTLRCTVCGYTKISSYEFGKCPRCGNIMDKSLLLEGTYVDETFAEKLVKGIF